MLRRFRSEKGIGGPTIACTLPSSDFWCPGKLCPPPRPHGRSGSASVSGPMARPWRARSVAGGRAPITPPPHAARRSGSASGDSSPAWRIHAASSSSGGGSSSGGAPEDAGGDAAQLCWDWDATLFLLRAKRVRMPLPLGALIPFTALDSLSAFMAFSAAMAPGGAPPDLLHCCLLIAKQAYPKSDEQAAEAHVERLAREVQALAQQRRQQAGQQAEQQQQQQQQQAQEELLLSCIRQVLYQQQGYTR
jgi:hypothetical protein